jgi:hypothetical protein
VDAFIHGMEHNHHIASPPHARDQADVAESREPLQWHGDSRDISPYPQTLGDDRAERRHLAQKWKLQYTSKILRWTPEFLALIASFAFFVAITTVLLVYNHDQTSSWKYSIGLNSLIAILATLFRSTMVTVTESGASSIME